MINGKLWVKWVEPFVDSDPVHMCVSVDTAVKYMRSNGKGYSTASDEHLLADFCTVNWAQVTEEKP